MPFTPYLLVVALVHLCLLALGIWLLVIDARSHRLPNRIVLPALGVLLVLVVVDALVTGDGSRLLRAILGMLLLGLFYALLRGASGGGIGGGDVKLAAAIGLVLCWHGWGVFLLGAAMAFVLGALYALALLLLRRVQRSTRIAFGPWMIAGAAAGIVLG